MKEFNSDNLMLQIPIWIVVKNHLLAFRDREPNFQGEKALKLTFKKILEMNRDKSEINSLLRIEGKDLSVKKEI